jgi:hypothetical protein
LDFDVIKLQTLLGPSVLEIINSLLSHLRVSVTRNQSSSSDEQLYQEALINALGEFANHLPDYQKIEIMMFIMSKVPYSQPDRIVSVGKGDVLLQSILLKSLLKVTPIFIIYYTIINKITDTKINYSLSVYTCRLEQNTKQSI